MNDVKEKYLQYCKDNHPNSGTASSYVPAINKLNEALHRCHYFKNPNDTIWSIQDFNQLGEVYEIAKKEQKKTDGGIFKGLSSSSYWQRGFCSAAIKEFAKFLALSERQEQMLELFKTADSGAFLAKELASTKLHATPLLLDNDDVEISSAEGKTAIRNVEVRQNQYVFRRMVLENYHSQCCLTGLPIKEVLRASHISPWALDKDNRLNPENGLCLSATYDAAFDRYLISFDEDYCLILSPSLKDYYTSKAFQEQFLKLKGTRIAMPERFYPSQKLLEKHRGRLV